MHRIVRNGELFHGEQKANSHNSGKNGLKTIVVVVVYGEGLNGTEMKIWQLSTYQLFGTDELNSSTIIIFRFCQNQSAELQQKKTPWHTVCHNEYFMEMYYQIVIAAKIDVIENIIEIV